MKFFILLFTVLLSGTTFSQYYNISPQICDSNAIGDYTYYLEGYCDFPDTFSLHIELIDYPGDTTASFQNVVSFEDSTIVTTIPDFQYNSAAGTFTCSLGNFPHRNLMIHLWVEINGIIENETFYRQYND